MWTWIPATALKSYELNISAFAALPSLIRHFPFRLAKCFSFLRGRHCGPQADIRGESPGREPEYYA
ncbi:MAG: hypothetical protein LBU32_07250 [Clostridiales bacterium]|nr:hypothetical protein [Clostridiales bacterium]